MTTKLKEGIKTDEIEVVDNQDAEIFFKIKEYTESNKNIVATVSQIDSEVKRLSDLKVQYINLGLSNNGALSVLQSLLPQKEDKDSGTKAE